MRTIAHIFNLLAAVALACAPAYSQVLMHRRKAFQGGGGGATYLVNQNFEGTGFDNSETWTTSVGSPDPDHTPALLGSQSMLTAPAGASGRVRFDFTPTDNAWGYFRFKRVGGSVPGGERLMFEITENGGSTRQFVMSFNASGALVISGTSAGTATTSATMSLDVEYHIWWKYFKGTGGNAIGEVAFSTTTTEPTSGSEFATFTDGNSTLQAGRVWLGYTNTNANSDLVYDKILIDDADIGSNP